MILWNYTKKSSDDKKGALRPFFYFINIIKLILMVVVVNWLSTKLILIQMCSWFAVTLANAIILYSFYECIIIDNWIEISQFKFRLTDFFFLLFALFIMRLNMLLPFSNYGDVENEEDIEQQLKYELSDITNHITASAIVATILILAMNFIRL